MAANGYAWDVAKNIFISALELITYNPVLDAARGSYADALPTVVAPVMQVENNFNFNAAPIWNEYANRNYPAYKQVNEHTFTNGEYIVSDLRPRITLIPLKKSRNRLIKCFYYQLIIT
jgi:hypothetical protein